MGTRVAFGTSSRTENDQVLGDGGVEDHHGTLKSSLLDHANISSFAITSAENGVVGESWTSRIAAA